MIQGIFYARFLPQEGTHLSQTRSDALGLEGEEQANAHHAMKDEC